METEAGTRLLIVEQKGRDVWRGRHRSLHDAIVAGDAGIGVDRILLTRAAEHNVSVIFVVVEEQRRIFLTPIDDLLDGDLASTRTNFQGRATRIVPYSRWHQKYLGPPLRSRSKRASA